MGRKKSSSKEPFMPLFFGDFLAATAEWEGEERSLYLTLLAYQWSLGSLSTEPRKLCKLVGWSERLFEQYWPTVSAKFQLQGNRLINARLEEHRAKTIELSEKNSRSGKKGAETRWGVNGERHGESMANATKVNGERHGCEIANANESDGKRHKSANGERYGATDSNPSHPIPSYPTPDISSQDSSGAALPTAPEPRRAADLKPADRGEASGATPGGSDKPRPAATPPVTPETLQVDGDPPQLKAGPNPTPAGAMAVALRNARVSVTSDDPTLLAWIAEGITTEQLLEAAALAKLRKPREIIPAKYLDPIVRELRAKAGAPPKPKQETPAEREWRLLRAEASQEGFHRQPGANETPDQYREALKRHQRAEAGRADQRLAELSGGALKVMPT